MQSLNALDLARAAIAKSKKTESLNIFSHTRAAEILKEAEDADKRQQVLSKSQF